MSILTVVSKEHKQKIERDGFKMRKSIKKIAATMLAATMVFGTMVSAFADDAAAEDTIQDVVKEGQTIYSIGSAMAPVAWAPIDVKNAMTETEWPGVYSININVPAAADSLGDSDHRFGIIATDYDTSAAWNRIVLGAPQVTPDITNNTTNCLSNIRVALSDEAKVVTIYFDSATYAITLKDADGNAVDYTISLFGNDDDEEYYTPEELSSMTLEQYVTNLTKDKNGIAVRAADIEACGITSIPDFVSLEAALVDKLSKEPETKAPETTKAEETTAAATTVADTTAAATTAAATTAANQATKTGDVAPVALMVVLFAAVATVAVVAKKKEA